MAWKEGRNVNWFMEIMAVLKQIESMELEFSAIVTTDLTVLLEQFNYWSWTVKTELLETMELREKSSCYFGFCQNYLPPLPLIWTTCTTFEREKRRLNRHSK